MTTPTVIDVKSGLNGLKKAVSAVTKADKVWLTALEGFFEFIKPDNNTPDGVNKKIADAVNATLPNSSLRKIKPDPDLSIEQAVRLVLDEVSFLQFADKKLEGKVLGADSTSEGLGKVVIEAEAYLVMTDEAFELLTEVCAGVNLSTGIEDINDIDKISGIDTNFTANLKPLREAAEVARNGGTNAQGKTLDGLANQVGLLLQSPPPGQAGVVTLPPTEPEGTDLLLGRKLSGCAEIFIKQIPLGSKEYDQTVALLEGGHLTLSNGQIRKLIGSWEKAVKAFVQSQILSIASGTLNPQQAFNQEFGSLDTIAGFLCVHNVLDTLYDRLETKVTRTVEIISTDI